MGGAQGPFSVTHLRGLLEREPLGKNKEMLNFSPTTSVGILIIVTCTQALAATGVTPVQVSPAIQTPVEKLQAFPKEVFAQEGTAVLFTAKATEKNAKLALIQVDEAGQPLHYIGIMTDDKTFGDRVRGDGVYSRKMEIKGRRGTRLHFAVVTDNGQIDEKTFHALPAVAIPGPHATDLEVILRPTFVQLMHNVWDRFRNSAEKQPESATY